MDFSNAPADFIINIVAGIVGALVILIVVDARRRPHLKIKKTNPLSSPERWTYLRIFVDNQPMTKLLRFLNREPAYATRAWISFYHLEDGTPVYDRQMVGRWSETPPPQERSRTVSTPEGNAIVFTIPESRDWEDIPPEEGRNLDICVKRGAEAECYGWNNDYQIPNQWQLDRGRYFVKVCVKTSGQQFIEVFQLINDNDYRLEYADLPDLKSRYKQIKHWGL